MGIIPRLLLFSGFAVILLNPEATFICAQAQDERFELESSYAPMERGEIGANGSSFILSKGGRNDKVKVTRRDQVKVTHPGLKSFSLVPDP